MPSVSKCMQIDVDFEAWCEECNSGICHLVSDGNENIYITPCETCLDNKYEEAHGEGYSEGEGSRDTEVETLENTIEDLEQQVAELESKVAELEAETEAAREEGWSEGFIAAKDAA